MTAVSEKAEDSRRGIRRFLPRGMASIQPTEEEICETEIPEVDWVEHFKERIPLDSLRARIARESKLKRVMLPVLSHPHGLADRRFLVKGLDATIRLLGLRKRAMRNFEKIHLEEREWVMRGLGRGFDGFRILHISDLHLEFTPGLLGRLRQAISGVSFDLVCLTGDFFDLVFDVEQIDRAALRELLALFDVPVKAVLGNHDPLAVGAVLEEEGAKVLLNESEILERNGDRLFLAGLDDPRHYRAADMEKVMPHCPDGVPSLLLVHSPQVFAEAAAWGVSLTLCGHTHGGQVCLPFGFPIANKFQSPRRYMSRDWEYKGARGYTSNGCGGCKLPYRLNAPAEIAVHTLRSGTARRGS